MHVHAYMLTQLLMVAERGPHVVGVVALGPELSGGVSWGCAAGVQVKLINLSLQAT